MQDFLNAKSMVTPGVAGGLIMVISNTCWTQFNLPPKWTALALSALLGLLVVCILIAPFWQKVLLWLFNALIIFSMAMGTNQAGVNLKAQSEVPRKIAAGPFPTPRVRPSASPPVGPSPSGDASPVVRPSLSPEALLAPIPHRIQPKMINTKAFFRSW
jgi:hypothetical protein